jgi:hypothetical protein
MSLIKANAVQIGQSPTATQNFTLAVPSSPDGTIKLARGNSGTTTQDVMNVSNAGVVSFPQGFSGNASSATAIATGSTTARSLANRFADVVNVKDFGAVGDGVTDDTDAIQAAINYASTSKKRNVKIQSDGVYLIDSANIVIPDYITIFSDVTCLTYPVGYGVGNVYNTSPTFIINPLYSIQVSGIGVTIKGISFLRKGWARAANSIEAAAIIAAMSGTAITTNKDDTTIKDCFIAGFQYAIYGDTCGRYLFENVKGDNINGIYTKQVYDVGRIVNCHFFPYLTSGSGDAALTWRNGSAFIFDNVNDWSEISGSFSYGYQTGIKVQNSNNVKIVMCGMDGSVTGRPSNSKSYHITGTSTGTIINSCTSSSHDYGYYFDTTDRSLITNCWSQATGSAHFYYNNGVHIMSGCFLFGSQSIAALVVGNNVSSLELSNNIFSENGQVFSIDSNSLFKVDIHTSNKYQGTSFGLTTATNKYIQPTTANGDITYHIGGANGYQKSYALANGTTTTPTAVTNGQFLGLHKYFGHDGTNFVESANIRSNVNGTVSTGVVPTGFVFATTNTSGVYADRLTVDRNGSFLPVTDNLYQIGANGARFASIWAATGVVNSSDKRLKKDIEDSSLGLDFVKSLHPVSYKWIEGSKKVVRQVFLDKDGNEIPEGEPIPEGATPGRIIEESIPGERTHFGLLAQEVKAALPEGVDFGGWVLTDKENPDSQQALRYDQFIAPLIKAVQELSQENALLKQRIEALESK